MTQLINQKGGPRPALLLLALLAVVTAALFGASQYTGARAQTGSSSITIVKQGLLGDDVASFTHNMEENGAFDLGGANGTSITFSDLEAGTYEVTELPLAGYTLTGAGCELSTNRAAPSLNATAGNTLGITVAEGQDLTCTFINGSTQVIQYDVTITKYVDGALATEGAFAFTATWQADNLNAGVETSGDFNLNSGNAWTAVTSPMDAGASYSVVENRVDETCETGDTHSLAGYTVGATPEDAAAGAPGATAAIADLQADMHVIVWDETCAPVGTSTLTIVKVGLAEGDSASFTHDLPGQASDTFELTSAAPGITFENLPAGSYNITETPVAGYNLTAMGCGFSLAPQAVPEGNNLVVVLGDDEDQTCTFVNEQETHEVTVTKYVDGVEATDGAFDFTETIDAAPATFQLNDVDGYSLVRGPIPFGSSYALVEDGIDGTCDEGDAYRLAGYSSGATAEEAAAAAARTETLTVESLEADLFVIAWNQDCTNIASITFVKDFEPDSADTEASYTVEGPGLTDFSIFEGEANGMAFANLNAGSYTFTEEDIEGWMLQSIFCSGQSSPSNILINLGGGSVTVTVNAGDAITCTFTNIEDDSTPEPGTGSITLTKNWTGDEAGPDATFALSANLEDDDDSVTLVDDGTGNTVTYDELAAGAYTFDEAPIAGWNVTGISCTGIVPESFDVNLTDGTLSVDLAEGMAASCTLTNTEVEPAPAEGSLIIAKVFIGEPAETATFTTSENLGATGNTFDLAVDSDPELFDALADGGPYVVTETDMAGWTLTDITCTGATASIVDETVPGAVSVTLSDGEDVTCTFTNTLDEPVENTTNLFPGIADTNVVEQPSAVSPSSPDDSSTNNNPPTDASSPSPVTNDAPSVVDGSQAPQANAPQANEPQSNVAGERQAADPLPPDTGNTRSRGNADAIALAAIFALLAGLTSATIYGLRRR